VHNIGSRNPWAERAAPKVRARHRCCCDLPAWDGRGNPRNEKRMRGTGNTAALFNELSATTRGLALHGAMHPWLSALYH
jgi:hypothetical protein